MAIIKRFLLLICLSVLAAPAKPAAAASATQQQDFYGATSGLLQDHVQEGQVNYRSLQEDKARLQRLVQQLAIYDLRNAPAAECKAFYLNAYNLLVLWQVLEHYPLPSVMDVPGFFDKRQYRVAGENLTLNQLEKQKLMATYRDARVHFALVCAARSCPPLLNTAYLPDRVEEQLEAQAKRALQDPAFVRIHPDERKVLVSELFKWYRPDFLRQAPSLAAYINRFRSTPLPPGYRLGYYPYNWGLNDSRK
ncbi:DUF547 domain-containing protein [Pontibacter russatus]|uniref:DUF547 domain-containing protein n=1 Tax=Pontibacter russatus TaxID=2694929 RepID=UPI00137975A9|nr:DUF547 domain-containing protein [Pontibacter russatus]